MAAIFVVVGTYGDNPFDDTGDFDYKGYIYAAAMAGIFSIVCSGLMMLVMMRIPTLLIKTSLIFVVVMSGLWAVMAFVYGQWFVGLFGILFFFIGICYARAVWSRIPFASANLVTACSKLL